MRAFTDHTVKEVQTIMDRDGVDWWSAVKTWEDEVPDCGDPGPDCVEHQGRCD